MEQITLVYYGDIITSWLRLVFGRIQYDVQPGTWGGEGGGHLPLPWFWKKRDIFVFYATTFCIFLYFAPPPRKSVKILPPLDKTEMTSLRPVYFLSRKFLMNKLYIVCSFNKKTWHTYLFRIVHIFLNHLKIWIDSGQYLAEHSLMNHQLATRVSPIECLHIFTVISQTKRHLRTILFPWCLILVGQWIIIVLLNVLSRMSVFIFWKLITDRWPIFQRCYEISNQALSSIYV